MNPVNKVGMRFGRLVVREYLGSSLWLCDCDCGNSKIVKSWYLDRGDTKSCGCMVHEPQAYEDFTGRRFGSLSVIRHLGKVGKFHSWECECDCGQTVVLNSNQIRRRKVLGCHSCLSKQLLSTMSDREWRDIAGYEGLYAVSSLGEIYSYHSMRIMKTRDNGRGYRMVGLHRDGQIKCLYVHRIVADAFLDNPDNLPEVNHKDANKSNNAVDNLEWVSSRQNYDHALENNLYERGADRRCSKLTEADVRYIKEHCVKFDPVFGIKPLAERFGVSSGTVESVVNGRNWRWVK